MNATLTQPTLFTLPPPDATEKRTNAPAGAPDALHVVIDGKTHLLDSADIDALEKECGPCKDENGVSLWRILRDIHANGARKSTIVCL